MKDEINKIIQSISDFYKLDNALKYYLDRYKAQILLDYITNLQEENERLNNIIDELEKYINEEIEDYNKALNSKLLSESGKEKYEAEKVCFLDMLDKLNELKEK